MSDTQNPEPTDVTPEDYDPQVRALAEHLELELEYWDDITESSYQTYGATPYSIGSYDYLVLTESEADAAALASIRDTVWAFKSSFLAEFTDLPEEVFIALSNKYDDSNDAVEKLIEKTDGGMEDFAAAAVEADGRGHFLSGYDGKEHEVEIDGETYFIYKN